MIVSFNKYVYQVEKTTKNLLLICHNRSGISIEDFLVFQGLTSKFINFFLQYRTLKGACKVPLTQLTLTIARRRVNQPICRLLILCIPLNCKAD